MSSWKAKTMQHDILEVAQQYIAKGMTLPADIRWELTNEQWQQLAISRSDAIVTEQRSADWIAYAKGNRQIWEAHRTERGAIESLKCNSNFQEYLRGKTE